MATPITWRNVGRQNDSAAASLLRDSQASINAGLGGLQNLVRDRQALDTQNREVLRQNARQSFLDSLNQYQDVDAFNRDMESGAITRNLAALDARTRGEVQEAVRAMPEQLMNRQRQASEFADFRAQEAATPLYESLRASVLDGSFKPESLTPEQQATLNQAGLYDDLLGFNQTTVRQRADQEFQDFARERERTAAEREDDLIAGREAAGRLIRDTVAGLNQTQADRVQALKDLATEMNITQRDADGNIDFDAADPGLVLAYQQQVRDRGLGQPITNTAVLEDVRRRILDSDLPLNEANTYIQMADDMLAGRGAVATADAQAYEQEVRAVQDRMARNPLYTEGNSPNPPAAVADALQEALDSNTLLKEEFDSNASLRNRFGNKLLKAITDGVNLGGNDKVKLVPSDIRLILTQYGKDWKEMDDMSLDEMLRTYANQDHIRERQRQYLQAQDDLASIETRYRSRAGTPNPADRLLEVLQNAANEARRVTDEATRVRR